MGTVDSVSPAKAGLLNRWAKIAVLSLAGTGVVGNEVVTHVNQYNQNQEVRQLTDEVARNQFSMQNMIAKINQLNGRVTLDQVMDTVKKITPSTVRVEGPQGLGSGVIIFANNNRYILTNAHVIQNNNFQDNAQGDAAFHISLYNGSDFATPIQFNAAPVVLSNGQRAYSPPEEHDFALLQIPADVVLPPNVGILMRDLEANPVNVGEAAIVVGNPFGVRDSVSFGIISHTDRKAEGLNINHHFQTDAPINPGNSGGGLFDMQGRLIGINTWGYRGGDGVGGSIRIDEIAKVLNSWGIKLAS